VSAADAVLEAEESTDGAGLSLAAGDIDADGLDDLLIGAPYDDNAGINAGAAYIILGSSL
jgi:hypothetical protein